VPALVTPSGPPPPQWPTPETVRRIQEVPRPHTPAPAMLPNPPAHVDTAHTPAQPAHNSNSVEWHQRWQAELQGLASDASHNAPRTEGHAPDGGGHTVVGRGVNDFPCTLRPIGGPGVGGVGQPPGNAFDRPQFTDADRARHRLNDVHQGALNDAALQLDEVDNAVRDLRASQARDTGVGVSVFTGRGSGGLPHPGSRRLHEATSLIGVGSSECHGQGPTNFSFNGSLMSDRYADTILQGGNPTYSEVGKAWRNTSSVRKFTNRNKGMMDSAITGPCAATFINKLVASLSTYRHDTHEARDRALRHDMLSNVVDEVKLIINACDEHATWSQLVRHFLQTCGPPDILTAVEDMLREAASEEPQRNL